MTYGGAKQYTPTCLPTGNPLLFTVLHVLGSAHISANNAATPAPRLCPDKTNSDASTRSSSAPLAL
jgi:hypothetical protein